MGPLAGGAELTALLSSFKSDGEGAAMKRVLNDVIALHRGYALSSARAMNASMSP
jgi:hypothetical protein